MHEIVVYGGGAIYRDVLQGVALMSGANGLSTLLRIAMLLGLIITIFKMAFDLDVKSAFKWFLTRAEDHSCLRIGHVCRTTFGPT